MGSCLAGKPPCKQEAVLQVYAGYVGPGELHRYTGIAFCYDHAKRLLGRHAAHFWQEVDAVEHDRAAKVVEGKR